MFTLGYVNTALNQSAFRIYKCYVINAINVSVGRAGISQGYILRFKQCFPNHLSMNSKKMCMAK